ncbi:anthranilate synthase component I [Candidatus Uzinura diaspidicola str. ASNER]|uniref:Anthranilate synthase component 1 n=1 Tax=Candidatus Uzinura diaspidicola str. ASNER TaxID=1133592 RepID=L7VJC9_9FLAO|nr:anthranilate synthase component I [Candidatus Uzinura diaspidicola str. ASNER]
MYRLKSYNKTLIADTISPIEIYLKLRNLFTGALLLESFHAQQKNFSIICIDEVAEIIMDNGYIYYRYPDNCEEKISLTEITKNGCEILEKFMKQLYSENKCLKYSGYYGYISYDSLPYFEDICLRSHSYKNYQIPKVRFAFFRTLIIFNNFNNILNLYSHIFSLDGNYSIFKIISLIMNHKIINLPFRTIKRLSSNLTDNGYKKSVGKSIRACKLGDVFQIVPSRQYQQEFQGDEFNVYRNLRSINPSPHLFYFDYGDYKIFGSSPEYQFTIKNRMAYIYPIAGTALRTVDDLKNKILAEELSKNTKENSEHVMLVDLARNDLSRNYSEVKVERYKEIKSFSHVFHLESKVSGKLPIYYSPVKGFVGTFPAGTLAGAPKYKAMELLDEFERQSRGIYGGSIGFFCLDGRIHTAIIIRTFLSMGNTLFMQAGAGVVADSTEEKELQEVDNKLKALNKAIIAAEKSFIK